MIACGAVAKATPVTPADTWIRRAILNNPFKNLVKKNGTAPWITMPAAWAAAGKVGIEDPKFFIVGDTVYCYCACCVANGSNLDFYLMTTSLATYPNGWTAVADPVIQYGQHAGIDDQLISSPYPVQKLDGTWLMFGHAYNGSVERICVWSGPAITGPWTWVGVAIAPTGGVNFIQGPCVAGPRITPDGKFHMLYGGATSTTESGFRGYHAVSDDGITWTADATPPIVLGPTGAWNSTGVHPVGQWIQISDVLYLPVQGWNGSTWQLGAIATKDFTGFPWVPNNAYLTADGGTGWGRGAVENPGTLYHEDTGKLDLFPVSASTYGTVDYTVFLAQS